MMEVCGSSLEKHGNFGTESNYSSGIKSYRLTSVFIPSLAPVYPSITDELRKDIAILKTYLEIRKGYIDKLIKAGDLLISKIDLKELHIESFKNRIKKYQKFF